MSHGCRWHKLTIAAIVAVLGLAATSAKAQNGEMAPNTGNISLSAGVDFTSEYFFRGIYQGPTQDTGVIVQPYLDVAIDVAEVDRYGIGAVSVYFGTWNSLATETEDGSDTGGADDVWYEADWYVGTAIDLPANLTLDLSYTVLYNPAGGDIFAEEIGVGLAYDDSEMWGQMFGREFGGLQPYVHLAFETNGASDGFEGRGIYLELGVEPSFTIVESETAPVDLAIPVTAGFSPDGRYYEADTDGDGLVDEDDEFGFVDVGLVASMPLTFVPADYGSWSASAGVHFLFLGDGAEALDETQEDFHVLGTFGIAMEY